MIPRLVESFTNISRVQKKIQEELLLKSKISKTFSVKEILEGDSSSDEDLKQGKNYNNNSFPWLKADYQNKYDDLEFDSSKYNQDTSKFIYPKSNFTD